MILQERNYIKQQKDKYLKSTVIWTACILIIFVAGIFILDTRKSYFTVFAGVLVIGAALNLTRWIGFSRFKDGIVENKS